MSEFVPASRLYDIESRTPIAHPAHQASDADVQRTFGQREIRADGDHASSGMEREHRCVECGMIRDATHFGLASDGDYVTVLEHFLEEHRDSDVFRRVIESTWVEVDCEQCGKTFNSPVHIGDGRFLAENFCTRCASHFNPIKQLVVRDLTAEELLEKNVDPLEGSNEDAEWRLHDESEVDHDV